MMNIAKDHKVNEQIRVRQIRLIGGEGEQVGIIDTREAMNMAREAGLDLVMVSPQAVPPVCRLLDYGRFRYEQQQNERENRKRARGQEVKAIKFRVKIDAHDFKTKTGHVRRFLEEGHKVKVTIMFRGRERTHPELGERILVRVAETLADIGVPESNPSMMGMDMNMIMTPRAAPAPKKEREDGVAAAPQSEAQAPAAQSAAEPTTPAQSTPQADAPAEAPASA
ncbi:translation initiation factor IF-3 [Deinococcus sp. D7000]|uniref:Translation initiation factor IF-3 n=2 Tax=Deinococcus radiopugnans ATCC 19172 TaxID=585398 RepID=A0A5C4Y548_9DEIO|nr:translation initiation factor IF-3 [Deinococcus radiopugnans]QLG09470.1 translation initiation factor IF-3 [Deinococcus sp. D7000]TNM70569.1 translation initiation factor IF-3 [Deinococcus radiopugnans ATCC 19172]